MFVTLANSRVTDKSGGQVTWSWGGRNTSFWHTLCARLFFGLICKTTAPAAQAKRVWARFTRTLYTLEPNDIYVNVCYSLQLHLNSDGDVIQEKDKEFFFIPASPEMELHTKMPISVTALKDILPVSWFSLFYNVMSNVGFTFICLYRGDLRLSRDLLCW